MTGLHGQLARQKPLSKIQGVINFVAYYVSKASNCNLTPQLYSMTGLHGQPVSCRIANKNASVCLLWHPLRYPSSLSLKPSSATYIIESWCHLCFFVFVFWSCSGIHTSFRSITAMSSLVSALLRPAKAHFCITALPVRFALDIGLFLGHHLKKALICCWNTLLVLSNTCSNPKYTGQQSLWPPSESSVGKIMEPD